MKCPNCGAVYNDDVQFCINCGKKLEPQVPENSYYAAEKSSNNLVWIVIAIAVTTLFVGGGAYWYFNMSSQKASAITDAEKQDNNVEEQEGDASNQESLSSTQEFSPNMETVRNSGQTLYFVVVASREDMDEAIRCSQNMPDMLEGPVYKAWAKGKIVYRVCCGCYTNKKDAKDLVNTLATNYNVKSWIWQDDTNAECVYRPSQGDVNSVDISSTATNQNSRMVYSSAYDGYVNIRSSASTKSAILGELHNGGDGATYLGKHGKWYKVNYNGVIGYCHSSQCYIE